MATRRRFAVSLAGAAAWLASRPWPVLAAQAQAIRSAETFRAGAELVPTPVTVRDGTGRLVTTLERDDFTLAEAGMPQPVTQFTRDRVPVSVALVLDVSDSMRGPRMGDARHAIRVFLEDHMAPEDEAALLVFNHAPHLLSGWSTDRPTLIQALEAARPTGGTAIYDAVGAALPLMADRAHPRGAIVLVSDGADTASDATVTELKQQLGRGDVFLYGIAVDTPNERSATRINPQVFRELAAQSGGYAEVVTSTADIALATARIADELNAQYMLGYSPVTPANGQYRSIRVSIRKAGNYVVRARRGVVR